jgi:hypothetical protein
MTEAEWLTGKHPDTETMLKRLGPGASPRKLRLLLVACARRVLPSRADREMIEALAVAERFADGLAKRSDLKRAREALTKSHSARAKRWPLLYANDVRMVPAWHANRDQIVRGTIDGAGCCAWSSTRRKSGSFVTMTYPDRAFAVQAALVRNVFGNPFRPVAVEPSWLTSDVVALARGIYDEKAFDRMPILADALQDAGCANDDVLTHCRDAKQVHVRGCWVVDLLLGLSLRRRGQIQSAPPRALIASAAVS